MKTKIFLFTSLLILVSNFFSQTSRNFLNEFNKKLENGTITQDDIVEYQKLNTSIESISSKSSVPTKTIMKERLDSIIKFSIDTSNGQQADQNYKIIYNYDSNSINMFEKLDYDVIFNTVYNRGKYIRTFTNPDHIETNTYQKFNSNLNIYKDKTKEKFFYNGNNIDSVFFYKNEYNQWKIDFKYVVDSTFGNNIMTARLYYWDSAPMKYIDYAKLIYNYNSNNDIVALTIQSKDINSNWIDSRKTYFTYNINNLLVQKVNGTVDSSALFTPIITEKYLRDNNGNVIKYSYDEVYGSFVLYDYDIEYFYDTTSIIDTISLPLKYDEFEYNTFHKNKITNCVFNYFIGGQIDEKFNAIYYYSKIVYDSAIDTTDTTGTNALKEYELSKLTEVYPIPASDYITFKLIDNINEANIEIFDINGKKLLNKKINKSIDISLNEYIIGTYIYKIKIDDKIEIGKFIKN